MKKLEIIIRPEKVSVMKAILSEARASGANFVSVQGYGSEQSEQYLYHGEQQYEQIYSKTKVEVVVPDEKVEPIIEMVTRRISTGKIGDGKIFIYNVEDTVKVRTGERGLSSL
ncbi:MAG: P-II family nitrogen regulator [Lachnospiraceae bacterium]|nr:P-II family nitrogen regulator [Lachnospiraceae bacterium]